LKHRAFVFAQSRVGKQTQISCAQEPEQAPDFSLRVLDKTSEK